MIITDTAPEVRSLVAVEGIHITHLTITGNVGHLLLTYNGVGWIAREATVRSLAEANVIAMAEGWPQLAVTR